MLGMRDDTPLNLINLIRFGTVLSVDADSARAVVRVGDLPTKPLPWLSARAGASRTWSPPTVGEQVLVLSPNGNLSAGVVLTGIYSSHYPRPDQATADNVLISFSDGATLLYDQAAHQLKAALPAGGTVDITAPAGVTVHGSLTVSENVVAGTGASGSFTTPTGLTVMVQDGIVVNIF